MIAFILITSQNGRENEIVENLKKVPRSKRHTPYIWRP